MTARLNATGIGTINFTVRHLREEAERVRERDADRAVELSETADFLEAAMAPPSLGRIAVPATHRHKKRGTEYALIGYGKMQAENWHDMSANPHDFVSVDMREVAIYRSVDDGSLWVRPREEFEDGRFEAIAD